MNTNTEKDREKDQKFGQIMGIKIFGSSASSLLARVEGFISCNTKFYILTPNPEIILMAQKNEKLKNALNGTDLAIPDGVGLKLALPGLPIMKGREIFSELIKLAAEKDWKVFLLGGLEDEAEMAARKLIQRYKDIKILSDKGPSLNRDGEAESDLNKKLQKDVIDKINKFAPQLLFVAFGNPKQEIWVHEHYSSLNIGGAMAVGGTFRYVAGQSSLPPKWMANFGLEWLWRLITEPGRIGRILNAVIVFPIRLFIYKL